MDVALRACLHEIALEGVDGCTLAELWSLLKQRLRRDSSFCSLFPGGKKQLQLKKFRFRLWKALIQACRRDSCQLSTTVPQKSVDELDAWTIEEFQKNEDSVLLTVKEFQRRRILLAHHNLSNVFISDPAWNILCVVAQSRWHGITQVEVAKSSNLDARSAFHYIKECVVLRLMTKRLAYIDGVGQSLLHFTPYSPLTGLVDGEKENDEDEADDDTQHAKRETAMDGRRFICDTLAKAKNQTMAYADLRNLVHRQKFSAQKKYFINAVYNLSRSGNIEKMMVKTDEGEVNCVRLIQPYVDNNAAATRVAQQPVASSEPIPILADAPICYQLLRIIHEAGEKGLSILDIIRRSGHSFTAKFLEKCLNCLANTKSPDFTVKRTPIFVGRTRMLRWTAQLHPMFLQCFPPREKWLKSNDHSMESGNEPTNAMPLQPVRELSPEPQVNLLFPGDTLNAAVRRENLAKMLDQELVLDVGTLLTKQYKELYEADGPLMDRRTLKRLAETMEKYGKCRLITTRVLRHTGSYEDRQFMIHPSLNLKSPELFDAIRECQRRISVYTHVPKPGIVENLEFDRIELPTSELEQPATVEKQDEAQGVSVAVSYGFLVAKFLRAKLLHMFLYDYAFQRVKMMSTEASTSNMPVSKNPWRISMDLLFYAMPLNLYLKIVGLTSVSKQFDEYLKAGHPLDVPISQLPTAIVQKIYRGQRGRLLRALRRTLEILEALGMITFGTPGEETESVEKFLQDFHLQTLVPLRDYPVVNTPLVRMCEFTNRYEVECFWAELQQLCIGDAGGTSISNYAAVNENLPPALHFITRRACWKTGYILLPEQKIALLRHVNVVTKTTPYADTEKCRAISREIGIAITHVRNFFRRCLVRWNVEVPKLQPTSQPQDAKLRPVRKIRPKPTPASLEAQNVVRSLKDRTFQQLRWLHDQRRNEANLSLVNGESPMSVLLKNQSLVNKQALAQKEHEAMIRSEDTAVVEKVQSKSSKSKIKPPPRQVNVLIQSLYSDKESAQVDVPHGNTGKTRKRCIWEPEEDDRLTYAWIAVHSFFLRKKYQLRTYWPRVADVFPDRDANQLRRRFTVLMSRTSWKVKRDLVESKWNTVVLNLIERGDLPQEDGKDYMLNVEKHSSYIRELAESCDMNDLKITQLADFVPLPDSVEEIRRRFKIEGKKAEQVWQRFEIITPHTLRMNIKYAMPMTVEEQEKSEIEVNEKTLDIERVKVLLRMILLCPNAEYDARLASHLLNLFPKAITNEAIRQSWDEGTIVDVRQGSTSRRIPGRGYELSSKAASVVTAQFTNFPGNLLEKAHQFHDTILRSGSYNVSLLATDEEVFVMLSLLIQRLVTPEICVTDLPDPNKRKLVTDVAIQITLESNQADRKTLSPRRKAKRSLPEAEEDRTETPDKQPESELAIDVPDNILGFMPESNEEEKSLMQYVKADRLARVGFMEHRFVRPEYASQWGLPVFKREELDLKAGTITEKKSGKRKKFGEEQLGKIEVINAKPLRIWYNMTGKYEQRLYQKALESVILLLLSRPGLTSEHVYDRFGVVLSRCEILELLEKLVELSVITKQFIGDAAHYYLAPLFYASAGKAFLQNPI